MRRATDHYCARVPVRLPPRGLAFIRIEKLKRNRMPNKKLAAFVLMSALGASSHAAGPKDALNAFHAALAAGDKAKALELLSPDATIYESGHVERSRTEYADHHLPHDMDFAKAATRKVVRQSERIDGDTAVIWEETETNGTSRGKKVHLIGTETALLEKKGDAWTIVHVHWSSRKAK
jgi:ketosteroid isomerase-like protein